jgi:hypothetical protein
LAKQDVDECGNALFLDKHRMNIGAETSNFLRDRLVRRWVPRWVDDPRNSGNAVIAADSSPDYDVI